MIKKIFTWIGTLVGTIMLIWGATGLVNLGLRTYVFKLADQNCYYAPVVDGKPDNMDVVCESQNKAQRQRDAVNGLTLLLIGAPVAGFFYKRTKEE